MTIERKKIIIGAFEHEIITGSGSDMAAPEVQEALRAASPQGRIAKWKPHAERLGVGLKDLANAESLIDESGSVSDMTAFKLFMEKAIHAINIEQMERLVVPEVAGMQKHRKAQSKKGQKQRASRGMNVKEREKHDRQIIEDYKKTRLTKNAFSEKFTKKYGISPSLIRSILSKGVDS